MKKFLSKFCPQVFPLLLAALLVVGLTTSALAFTTNTGTSASVQAELPVGVFLGNNLGDVSLTEGAYYYDRSLGCYVQEYRLSDASKLSLLLDYCQPIYRLADEMERLEDSNKVGGLNRYLDSKQQVTIWDCLTKATQNKITGDRMNAEQALSYIKTSVEYQSNSTLQKYVKYYLEEILTGNEVRETLKIIDPSNATSYADCSVTTLLGYGEDLLRERDVKDLIAVMRNFRNETTTPRVLEQNYTTRQLARYYDDLSANASYFYDDYIDALDNLCFTVQQ